MGLFTWDWVILPTGCKQVTALTVVTGFEYIYKNNSTIKIYKYTQHTEKNFSK